MPQPISHSQHPALSDEPVRACMQQKVPVRGRVRQSLRFSFIDGTFASCMTGLTADYITPFALALNANNAQVGLLSAVPALMSSAVQFKAPDLVDFARSRKKIILVFVLAHLLMLVPLAALPFLPVLNKIPLFILCVTLFTGFNAVAGPAWASLMSDYVPSRSRGKYFGWRSKIFGMVTIASACCAGYLLHLFSARVLTGFALIFGLALVCRVVSWYFLAKMYEPRFEVREDAYFSFWDFIKRVRESNFAKFVLFVAGLNFCVNLAAPFFSVFMVRDLGFSYVVYTVLVVTVTVVTTFTIDRGGRHADRVGNVKIIQSNALIIASLPLWWLLWHNPLYLVLIQCLSGFAWSGFNLCATNFIYDAARPEKRTRCIAYFNACNGVATFSGALIGGFLVTRLPALMGHKIQSLFVISSLMRFGVVGLLARKIREVRPSENISSRNLFYSVIGFRPALGVTEEARRISGHTEE